MSTQTNSTTEQPHTFAGVPSELEALALELFSTTPGMGIDGAARAAFAQYVGLVEFASAWDFDVACLAIEAGDVETIEACHCGVA